MLSFRRGCLEFGPIATVALFLVSAHAAAQVEQGRFVGKITDPLGASVPGAIVVSRNLDTNIEQRAVSNDTGEYVITPVPAGNYSITVTSPGFRTASLKRIEVQVGQIVREDVPLAIGEATEVVQVDTSAPLVATDSATFSQVLTNKEVTDLPINGRSFTRLAQLTPGAVLLGATGNTLPIRPESVNGNVISGIRGSATSFLLDGVDTSEQHQGGTFIQASIDAIQEIGVTQSPYSAEFNRGGAFFNSTTKSGTNKFHGGVFEFLRNDYLDARNYFALTRQRLKRNQFGATLGGPVTIPHLYNGHDRTFFFFNYEGLRLRQTVVYNSVVPSDNARAGIFTGYKKIYDPMSNVNPQLRTEFPNDVIPANRIASQALAILQYYPRQNTTTGTYQRNAPQPINFDQYIARIDHQVSAANRLFVRWVYMKQSETDPNFSPALGNAPLTSLGQDIAAGLVSNIRPTIINEIRSHFLPSHVRLPGFLQGPDWNGQFGVTGFSDLLRNGSGSFPDYAWSNYASLQGTAFDQRPKSQDRKAWEIADNVTILHGNHSLKFGTLVRHYQWLGFDGEQFAGVFSFNGNQTTQQVSSSTTGGDAFADFLLGYPSSVQRSYPATNFGGEGWYRQFFFQDDIRFNERVTLNVGLRYEYSPWLSGYKGQVGTFDPTRSQPIIVGGNGPTPDLSAQPAAPRAYQVFGQYIQTSSAAGLPYNITYTDKRQWAPRVGLSVSLTPKTVLRSGFGIFYEPETSGGRVNLNVLPYRLNETQNQTQNAQPTRTLGNFFLGVPLSSPSANPSLVPTPTRLRMGQNIHYSLDIERQLSNHDMFDIVFVGNRGVHLNSSTDFNDPTPAAGTVQTRRPYPQWGTINYTTQDLTQNYASLQAKFNHRFSYNFSLLTAYTYSKLLQYGPTPAVGGNTGYEYALSPYDVPHNVAISGSYLLPFGRGRTFLSKSNGFVDAVLGGWQLQTIMILRSGTPFTLSINGDRANTGVGSQRPNWNPSGCNPSFKRSLNAWFDRGCYVDAPLYQYGTVRANTMRSDVYRQLDASIFKNFKLGESTLSFRLEAFNFPNLTTFAAPSTNIDSSTGGQVTSSATSPRNLQLALKYNF